MCSNITDLKGRKNLLGDQEGRKLQKMCVAIGRA